MGFNTSSDILRKVFAGMENGGNISEELMSGLKDYLKARSGSVREAKILYDWIDAGKTLCAFRCRNDLAAEFAEDLKDAQIPYIRTTDMEGAYGFLIRSCDAIQAGAARDAFLESKSKSCVVLNPAEMSRWVGGQKAPDKDMVVINGLTWDKAEYLRNKCTTCMDIEAVSIAETVDGKYKLAVQGRKALRKSSRKRYSTDLGLAVLMMQMALGGPNRGAVQTAAKEQINLRNVIAEDYGALGIDIRRTPVYVTGLDNQYMKIGDKGFEYGYVKRDMNGLKLQPLQVLEVESPDYTKQKNSFLRRFHTPVITTDIREVLHMDLKNADAITAAEEKTASRINDTVMRHLEADPTMADKGSWDEKMALITAESAKVLDGVIKEEAPSGYSEDDINAIGEEAKDAGLDPAEYAPAVPALRNMKFSEIENEIKKWESVEQMHAVIERDEQIAERLGAEEVNIR